MYRCTCTSTLLLPVSQRIQLGMSYQSKHRWHNIFLVGWVFQNTPDFRKLPREEGGGGTQVQRGGGGGGGGGGGAPVLRISRKKGSFSRKLQINSVFTLGEKQSST